MLVIMHYAMVTTSQSYVANVHIHRQKQTWHSGSTT